MEGIPASGDPLSKEKNCNFIGWDIGAANIKAARLHTDSHGTPHILTFSRPLEIWKEKDRLPQILREVFCEITSGDQIDAMAVTTTAELSDVFATKREGVLHVFNRISACFPEIPLYALSLAGRFETIPAACLHPLDFAAANWLATAQWISRMHPCCLIVDAGSTTTDIIPVWEGKTAVHGYTDTDRLMSGELIYTGVLRTNLAAIVPSAPVRGRFCRVASEYFAITADMHLILGNLTVKRYSCSTPDGQTPSVESARRRLARLVCADTEMLPAEEIDAMARYIYDKQVGQILDGLKQVLSRLPQLQQHPAIVVGLGAFLGREAALRAGLNLLNPEAAWNGQAMEIAPCIALAQLLKQHWYA